LIGADLHDPLRRWRGDIGFAQLVAELAVRGWLRGRLRSWLNSYTFSSLKRSLFIRALFVFSLLLMILSCFRFMRAETLLVLFRPHETHK